MSYVNGPLTVTNGLVMCLDAGNANSYPGTGTTWTDISNSGNSVVFSSATTYNSGYFSLSSTTYAGIASNTLLGLPAGSNNFSVGVWFNYNSVASYTAYFEKQNNAGGVLGTQRLDMGNVGSTSYFTTWNNSTSAIDQGNFAYTINTGNWYYGCLTCALSSKICYMNGQPISTSNFNSTWPDNNQALGIGGYIRKINGLLSNVTVYNRALSPAEVYQNFNALRGRFGI